MTETRLENRAYPHNKFWTVKAFRTKVVCSWGRIGSDPRKKAFHFNDQAEALEFYDAKIESKRMRGYKIVGLNPSKYWLI